MNREPRIALLIDADNSPTDMLDELAKEGVINHRRFPRSVPIRP